MLNMISTWDFKASNLDSVPPLRILHGRAYYRLNLTLPVFHWLLSSMTEIYKITCIYKKSILSCIVQAISYGPACPQQFPPGLQNKTEVSWQQMKIELADIASYSGGNWFDWKNLGIWPIHFSSNVGHGYAFTWARMEMRRWSSYGLRVILTTAVRALVWNNGTLLCKIDFNRNLSF